MKIYEFLGIDHLLMDIPIPQDVILENVDSGSYYEAVSVFRNIDYISLRVSLNRDEHYLQVMEIGLNTPRDIDIIAKIIQKTIKYRILFIFRYQEHYLVLWRNFKLTDSTEYVYSDAVTYCTDWIYDESLDMDVLWSCNIIKINNDYSRIVPLSFEKKNKNDDDGMGYFRDVVRNVYRVSGAIINRELVCSRYIVDWFACHAVGERIDLNYLLCEAIREEIYMVVDDHLFFEKDRLEILCSEIENPNYIYKISLGRTGRIPWTYFESIAFPATYDDEYDILSRLHEVLESDGQYLVQLLDDHVYDVPAKRESRYFAQRSQTVQVEPSWKSDEQQRREAEYRAAVEQESDRILTEQKAVEEESRRKAEEEARRKAEEEARRKAEEEARRKAEEEARRKAEEEARRKAEEEARRKAEEEARRKAEEEARRKAEEEARRKAEEEARRKAEEEVRRKAEEEVRRKAEEEARRKAEEARRKAEEEARRKAEEEARRKAEEEARRKAEEEARRKAEEEARRKAAQEADRLEQAKKYIGFENYNEYFNWLSAKIPVVFWDEIIRAYEIIQRFAITNGLLNAPLLETTDIIQVRNIQNAVRTRKEFTKLECNMHYFCGLAIRHYVLYISDLEAKRLAEAAKAEERRKAEEARRKAEEEARRKAAEEARRKAEEEARRKAEEEARRKAEEEARRKAEEEARRKAEEEARRKAEEEARRKAVEEARRKTEEARRRVIQETDQLERAKKYIGFENRHEYFNWLSTKVSGEFMVEIIKAYEIIQRFAITNRLLNVPLLETTDIIQLRTIQDEVRVRREFINLDGNSRYFCGLAMRHYIQYVSDLEAKHFVVNAKAEARRKTEEEARRKAEEEARQKAEEEARRKAEEEARRKAEEEARRKAEEEARRKAEEEARRKAEEEARRKAEEARRKAEEARRKAEEETRRKAEEEARRKAEEEARRKAEEEARRKAEEEARQKAEEERRWAVARRAQYRRNNRCQYCGGEFKAFLGLFGKKCKICDKPKDY